MKRKKSNPSRYYESCTYKVKTPYVVDRIIFDNHVRNTINKSTTAPTATTPARVTERSRQKSNKMAKKKSFPDPDTTISAFDPNSEADPFQPKLDPIKIIYVADNLSKMTIFEQLNDQLLLNSK